MWNIRRSLRILSCTAFTSAAIGLSLVPAKLSAQEHRHHPPQDMPLHEKFYSTWFMPDEPHKSCCNKADCYPTQVQFHDGKWWAMRREDGKYIPIPWKKVEINRNNPDGRNHLCAPPPSSYHAPDTVFCFALGGGI
jgi:hypothetical protein